MTWEDTCQTDQIKEKNQPIPKLETITGTMKTMTMNMNGKKKKKSSMSNFRKNGTTACGRKHHGDTLKQSD
jgi:hypothetical protein